MSKITANELLEILNNQWASTNDVKKIAGVGQNKALDIMKDIRNIAKERGYYLPKYLVPMEMVIEHFKINVSYLKKVSGGTK